jgi:hypothetical protein
MKYSFCGDVWCVSSSESGSTLTASMFFCKMNIILNLCGDINVLYSLNSIHSAKINFLYICTTDFVLFVLWFVSCHGNYSYSILCEVHTKASECGCHGYQACFLRDVHWSNHFCGFQFVLSKARAEAEEAVDHLFHNYLLCFNVIRLLGQPGTYNQYAPITVHC